ncbi:MAG: hypothetical protein LBK60_02435 [Verrucomicrobiales bacterium]|jgi:hypothetical protein|nr:hypothetical protein [Verrucomicrobiales bacterium]
MNTENKITFSGEISAEGYTLEVNGERFTEAVSHLGPRVLQGGDFSFGTIEGNLYRRILGGLADAIFLLQGGCSARLWLNPEKLSPAMLKSVAVGVLETIARKKINLEDLPGAERLWVESVLQNAESRMPFVNFNVHVQRGNTTYCLKGGVQRILAAILDDHVHRGSLEEFVRRDLRAVETQDIRAGVMQPDVGELEGLKPLITQKEQRPAPQPLHAGEPRLGKPLTFLGFLTLGFRKLRGLVRLLSHFDIVPMTEPSNKQRKEGHQRGDGGNDNAGLRPSFSHADNPSKTEGGQQ